MTSVHPRFDTRVFTMMCGTLVEVGHEVHLLAPTNNELEKLLELYWNAARYFDRVS